MEDDENEAKKEAFCLTDMQKAEKVKKYAKRILDMSVVNNVSHKALADMSKIFLELLADLGVLKSEELGGISIPATYYMLNKWAERDPPSSKLVPICETKDEDHHVFLDDDEHTCPVCSAARPTGNTRRYTYTHYIIYISFNLIEICITYIYN